tara:strand:- start:1237 stop:1389 length:153 start_codon:yes stop_codon:yes gene_type:complete
MIKNIISLLPYATGETENIRVAKGKYKMPTSLIESVKHIKRDLQWQEKNK